MKLSGRFSFVYENWFAYLLLVTLVSCICFLSSCKDWDKDWDRAQRVYFIIRPELIKNKCCKSGGGVLASMDIFSLVLTYFCKHVVYSKPEALKKSKYSLKSLAKSFTCVVQLCAVLHICRFIFQHCQWSGSIDLQCQSRSVQGNARPRP